MSLNGISHQLLKRDRQDDKLAIAEAKRQGKTVADNGTISGSADPTKVYARVLDTLDASYLPTRYNASSNTGALVDNPNTGGLIQGRPWIGFDEGIYLQPYSGYFADNVSWFATATTTGTASTPSTFASSAIATTTSYQYLGYFRPPTTGTYTFYISSDDAGYLWVGSTAVSGFTTANALASAPGEHALTEDSGTIAMTAGELYGFRAQVGNNGGPGEVIISFAGPSIAKTTTFTGYVFHNPTTNGI